MIFGLSWSWSYGSLIKQLIVQSAPVNTNIVSSNPAQTMCISYNIMWYSLSVTCDRSVVFFGYSAFLH